VWAFLLFITWMVPFSVAVSEVILRDQDTGAVLVFFPARSTARENFDRIVDAGGAFGGPALMGHAWLAYSYDAGFVGRLKGNGAWAVFDPLLLDPLALMGCGSFRKAR